MGAGSDTLGVRVCTAGTRPSVIQVDFGSTSAPVAARNGGEPLDAKWSPEGDLAPAK